MLASKDSPAILEIKKLKEEGTPVSTAVHLGPTSQVKLPSSMVMKPIWIGKLVNKFLKQMDSQQRIYKSLKKKQRHKSSNKLAEGHKNTFKNVNPTPKKRPAGRKQRQNVKTRYDLRVENNSTKKKSAAKSTRKRVQTAVSQRAGHSLSLTGKPKQKVSGDAAISTSQQSRHHASPAKRIKPKIEENPFSIYFKDQRNIRS